MTIHIANQQRADRCLAAIAGYSEEEPLARLTDFMADAMHWCHLAGHSFDDLLDAARFHYRVEISDEGSIL